MGRTAAKILNQSGPAFEELRKFLDQRRYSDEAVQVVLTYMGSQNFYRVVQEYLEHPVVIQVGKRVQLDELTDAGESLAMNSPDSFGYLFSHQILDKLQSGGFDVVQKLKQVAELLAWDTDKTTANIERILTEEQLKRSLKTSTTTEQPTVLTTGSTTSKDQISSVSPEKLKNITKTGRINGRAAGGVRRSRIKARKGVSTEPEPPREETTTLPDDLVPTSDHQTKRTPSEEPVLVTSNLSEMTTESLTPTTKETFYTVDLAAEDPLLALGGIPIEDLFRNKPPKVEDPRPNLDQNHPAESPNLAPTEATTDDENLATVAITEATASFDIAKEDADDLTTERGAHDQETFLATSDGLNLAQTSLDRIDVGNDETATDEITPSSVPIIKKSGPVSSATEANLQTSSTESSTEQLEPLSSPESETAASNTSDFYQTTDELLSTEVSLSNVPSTTDGEQEKTTAKNGQEIRQSKELMDIDLDTSFVTTEGSGYNSGETSEQSAVISDRSLLELEDVSSTTSTRPMTWTEIFIRQHPDDPGAAAASARILEEFAVKWDSVPAYGRIRDVLLRNDTRAVLWELVQGVSADLRALQMDGVNFVGIGSYLSKAIGLDYASLNYTCGNQTDDDCDGVAPASTHHLLLE